MDDIVDYLILFFAFLLMFGNQYQLVKVVKELTKALNDHSSDVLSNLRGINEEIKKVKSEIEQPKLDVRNMEFVVNKLIEMGVKDMNSDAYEKGYNDGIRGRAFAQGRAEIGAQKKRLEDYDRGYMRGFMDRKFRK